MSTTATPGAPGPWVLSVWTDDAASFHARDLPGDGRRHVWMYRGTSAVVLGSSQDERVVDSEAARALGYPIVRRRSGGGVVLVDRSTLWCDLIIPPGDALWSDDIGRSMHWVGDCWAAVLAEFGVPGEVHRGGYEASALSRLVCFGGLGAGEVHVDGAKLVGVSQRRTRAGARFQCALQGAAQIDEVAAVIADGHGLGDLRQALAPHLTSLEAVLGASAAPSHEELTTRFLNHLATA